MYHEDINVLNDAKRTKALEKHLETSISEEVYKNIEDVINS